MMNQYQHHANTTITQANTAITDTRGRSPIRFNLWAAYFIFNLITFGSSIQVKRGVEVGDTIPTSTRYTVICSSIIFVMTFFIVLLHFFTSIAIVFVGTIIEGIVCIILLLLSTIIVTVGTDASNGLFTPEDPTGGAQNANLYYFGWASLFTIIFISIDLGKTTFLVNDVAGSIRNYATRLLLWSGLLCTALIVMGSSIRIVRKECNNPYVQNATIAYCKRTRLGISVGTICVIIAIWILFIKLKRTILLLSVQIELGISILITILNVFNVAYITAAGSPGSIVGNLYYFSWSTFLISTMITANCFSEYTGIDPNHNDPNPAGSPSNQFTNQSNEEGDFEIGTTTQNI